MKYWICDIQVCLCQCLRAFCIYTRCILSVDNQLTTQITNKFIVRRLIYRYFILCPDFWLIFSLCLFVCLVHSDDSVYGMHDVDLRVDAVLYLHLARREIQRWQLVMWLVDEKYRGDSLWYDWWMRNTGVTACDMICGWEVRRCDL